MKLLTAATPRFPWTHYVSCLGGLSRSQRSGLVGSKWLTCSVSSYLPCQSPSRTSPSLSVPNVGEKVSGSCQHKVGVEEHTATAVPVFLIEFGCVDVAGSTEVALMQWLYRESSLLGQASDRIEPSIPVQPE
jgi:hypothetical protein